MREEGAKTLQVTAAALAACAVAVLAYLSWLPDVSDLQRTNPMTTQYVQIYVRRLLAKGGHPAVSMKWVPLEQISPHLRRAVLIAEDDLFYHHRGIDWRLLKKAVDYNLKKRKLARGASTITQQVARNLFLSPSRRPWRKLSELLIARHLERSLDKDRILEIYLNIVEWGEGIFGAEAASLTYFHKHASELSLEEAVALAVALPSPYRLNPAMPIESLTLKKREYLLERMRKAGYVETPP